MLFDQGTPDTSAYMIAGYAIFFAISIIYLASLFIRTRNLHQDLDTLDGLQEEEPRPAPAPASVSSPVKAKPARAKAAKAATSRKKQSRKAAKKR